MLRHDKICSHLLFPVELDKVPCIKKPLPREETQGRGNTGVKDDFIVLVITKELLAGSSIHNY
jgi:hypothetical protein